MTSSIRRLFHFLRSRWIRNALYAEAPRLRSIDAAIVEARRKHRAVRKLECERRAIMNGLLRGDV